MIGWKAMIHVVCPVASFFVPPDLLYTKQSLELLAHFQVSKSPISDNRNSHIAAQQPTFQGLTPERFLLCTSIAIMVSIYMGETKG